MDSELDKLSTESDMPESLKIQIRPYQNYYLAKLEEGLRDLLPGVEPDNQSAQAKTHQAPKTAKSVRKPRSDKKKETKKSIDQQQAEANAFSNQYFEFSNVIRQLHSNIVDNVEKENSYRADLPVLIEFFNKHKAIDLPMPVRVREVFDKGDKILNDPKANEESRAITQQAKIDFRRLINDLLRFYMQQRVSTLFKDFSTTNISDRSITVRHSKLPILIAITQRYRLRNVDDISELASEGIELVDRLKDTLQRNYSAIIVFTDMSTDMHEKIKFNFNTEVYKKTDILRHQVFIVPATLNNLGKFEIDLSTFFDGIRGVVIDFNYDHPSKQPLSQGWRAPVTIEQESGVLRNDSHPDLGRTWAIDFTNTRVRDLYVEHPFDDARLDRFRFMLLTIVPYPEAKVMIELQVIDRKDSYWLEIEGGDESAVPSPKNPSRLFNVRTPRTNDGHGWMTYRIDVEKLFALSFGKNGLKLQRISGIRLHGKVTIGRISLHP